MKKTIYILLLLIFGFLGFAFGRYELYTDIKGKSHIYSIQESLTYERKYSNALLEGLHWYMRDDSVYWHEMFMNTIEYKNIEKANGGDWEDFYSPNWK